MERNKWRGCGLIVARVVVNQLQTESAQLYQCGDASLPLTDLPRTGVMRFRTNTHFVRAVAFRGVTIQREGAGPTLDCPFLLPPWAQSKNMAQNELTTVGRGALETGPKCAK